MNKTSQHSSSFVATLAAGLLAGCAAAPLVLDTWPIAPEGSTWRVAQRATGSYGKDVQFTATGGRGTWQGQPVLTMHNSASGGMLMINTEGRWLAAVGPDGKAAVTYDPPIGWHYPLHVGKTWRSTHRITFVAMGKSAEFEHNCVVEAREMVTVPAGTFDTFRIACQNPQAKDVTWTSVEHGFNVKAEGTRTALSVMGPGTMSNELLAVNIKR